MRKVIGIGETILDIIFRNDQPSAAVPGGSVFNGIVSLGRMGVNVCFISETGNDHVGNIILQFMRENNIPFEEVTRLDDAMPKLDILYMTRVQKERFFNEEDYVRLKNYYILDKEKMKLAKDDMYVLHPLPRVNEISVEVDDDPRAAYFRQAQYGVYVRMALILTLLKWR